MTESTLIEGVGDEVTIVLGGFSLLIAVLIAWLSTRVVDVPYTTDLPNTENLFPPHTENDPEPSTAEPTATSSVPLAEQTPYNQPPETQSRPVNQTESFENIEIPSEDIPTTSHTQESNLRQRNVDNDKLEPGHFLIRLKFLDDSVKTIQVKAQDTIEEFRRKNFPPATADRYRLIYRGQVFRDNSSTLAHCGITPPAEGRENIDIPVIHCFLSAETSNTESTSNNIINADELNVGHFFRPIFGVIISILWYLSIYHTSLFTIPSLFCVVGLTCFYIVILVNQFL